MSGRTDRTWTTRPRRLATFDVVSRVEPLPVTAEAARHWARLQVGLAERGRRAKVDDLWIAEIAAADGLDVVTQDDDVDVIEEVGGPAVVRV